MRTQLSGFAVLAIPVLLALAAPLHSRQARDLSAGSVIPTSPMHAARAAHTATLLSDGAVLITGGFTADREDQALAAAELFDPDSNAFTPLASMTSGRQSHTVSLLPDGRVLIAGGFGRRANNTTEIYDPSTRDFKPAANLVVGRASHRASELPDGRVLISGGLDASGRVLSSIETYDPATGKFTTAGSLTTPRLSHTQTVLLDGTVLIVGGTSGRRAATQILASAEIFDPVVGTSTVVASMNTPRYKHAAVPLADGRVLVIAGSDDRDWNGRYDTAEIFDPATRTFRESSKLNSERFKLRTAAVRLNDGRVLVAGGSEIAEVFDPEDDRFHVVEGRLDEAFFFATATSLNDGRALIAGGYDRRIQSTRQAWIFTP